MSGTSRRGRGSRAPRGARAGRGRGRRGRPGSHRAASAAATGAIRAPAAAATAAAPRSSPLLRGLTIALTSRTGVAARRTQAVKIGSPGLTPSACSAHTDDHFMVSPSSRRLGCSASRTASAPPTRSIAATSRACARAERLGEVAGGVAAAGCCGWGCGWASAAGASPSVAPSAGASAAGCGSGARLRLGVRLVGLDRGLLLLAQLGELGEERTAVLVGGVQPAPASRPLLLRALPTAALAVAGGRSGGLPLRRRSIWRCGRCGRLALSRGLRLGGGLRFRGWPRARVRARRGASAAGCGSGAAWRGCGSGGASAAGCGSGVASGAGAGSAGRLRRRAAAPGWPRARAAALCRGFGGGLRSPARRVVSSAAGVGAGSSATGVSWTGAGGASGVSSAGGVGSRSSGRGVSVIVSKPAVAGSTCRTAWTSQHSGAGLSASRRVHRLVTRLRDPWPRPTETRRASSS